MPLMTGILPQDRMIKRGISLGALCNGSPKAIERGVDNSRAVSRMVLIIVFSEYREMI